MLRPYVDISQSPFYNLFDKSLPSFWFRNFTDVTKNIHTTLHLYLIVICRYHPFEGSRTNTISLLPDFRAEDNVHVGILCLVIVPFSCRSRTYGSKSGNALTNEESHLPAPSFTAHAFNEVVPLFGNSNIAILACNGHIIVRAIYNMHTQIRVPYSNAGDTTVGLLFLTQSQKNVTMEMIQSIKYINLNHHTARRNSWRKHYEKLTLAPGIGLKL